jgi:hypothetical protein
MFNVRTTTRFTGQLGVYRMVRSAGSDAPAPELSFRRDKGTKIVPDDLEAVARKIENWHKVRLLVMGLAARTLKAFEGVER